MKFPTYKAEITLHSPTVRLPRLPASAAPTQPSSVTAIEFTDAKGRVSSLAWSVAMNFVGRDEASLLGKKLRREIAEYPSPKFVIYYESGVRDYSGAANAIAQSTGNFSEATVLFLWAGAWEEHSAKDRRWSRYRKWRMANNEDRRLYEVPGHRFGPHEVEQFSEAIGFALELGWDALVAAKPGRQLLFLSHDDRLEIYRGFKSGLLIRQLTGLGYWRR